MVAAVVGDGAPRALAAQRVAEPPRGQGRGGHQAAPRSRSTTCSDPTRPIPTPAWAGRWWCQGVWEPAQTVFVSGRTRGYARCTGWSRRSPWPRVRRSRSCGVRRTSPAKAPAAPPGRRRWSGCSSPRRRPAYRHRPADDILPELSTTDLLPRTKGDLYGGYVVATDRTPPAGQVLNPGTSGLDTASVDNLPDAGSFTGLRNLLYALQWWVFGGFVIFVWWRWLTDDVLGSGRRGSPRHQ